ncbi:MAG: 50S ribosomal protein L9 [Flavobacteriales bacterium]|jgi:large subunit ribosomal protein L9|nr:50S ribosomal protein L9 [Flavobacteriaceae bacterium]RZP06548.1 MAG: 50S ribosomal protein L9 [Flavobacteriales bacterium]
MEIILKKDVEGVGFKDDVITVKNGFGRNFLIPNGSAILATPSAKKILTENLKQQAVKDKKIVDDANKIAKKIKALEIKIKSKVGEGKKLFGSVNNSNVQNELKENGVEIDKKTIMITGSSVIKQLGKYNAVIRLHRDVVFDLPFEVVAEKK